MATGGNGTTLSEDAYLRLRAAIIHGEFRPNERLVETELAERLALSRTPIREGLQRLAAEGLVVSRRRGWVVHEHTPAEIREIYEVRAALEGYAARLAAERGSDEALERIRAIEAEVTEAVTSREALVDLNDRFHDAVIAAAGNARLTAQTRSSREYFFNRRIAAVYSDEEARASIAEHEQLVEALLARDADRAERVAREHILEALDVTLSKLR